MENLAVMTNYRFSEDNVITHGIIAALDETFKGLSSTDISDMFLNFETIHKMLWEYKKYARHTVNEQIVQQCLYRYKEYKSTIVDSQCFLSVEKLAIILRGQKDAFNGIKQYGLHYTIEKAFLTIDYVMRAIVGCVTYAKNSSYRYFRTKRHLGKFALIVNDSGLACVLDTETNTGHTGYFSKGRVISDSTKRVGEKDWTFAKRKIENKTVYELIS